MLLTQGNPLRSSFPSFKFSSFPTHTILNGKEEEEKEEKAHSEKNKANKNKKKHCQKNLIPAILLPGQGRQKTLDVISVRAIQKL